LVFASNVLSDIDTGSKADGRFFEADERYQSRG